jgi:hypothetical protein
VVEVEQEDYPERAIRYRFFYLDCGLIVEVVTTMNPGEWKNLKEEICTQLYLRKESGEEQLETITRMIWLERLKYFNVCYAIENLLRVANSEAYAEKDYDAKKAKVLAWKVPGTL